MSEPLSIAATVAGLLAVCERIHNSLNKLAPLDTFTPPTQVNAQVQDLQKALVALQRLIPEIPKARPERKVDEQLNHLILALTQCVSTLSQLEIAIDPTWFNEEPWSKESKHRLVLLKQLGFQSIVMRLVESSLTWYYRFNLSSF
jgi:hypothetical protein